MKNLLSYRAIHLWILPLFFVLFCFNEPSQKPEFGELCKVVLATYSFALVVFGVFRFLIDDRINSALGSSITLIIALFFQFILFSLTQYSKYIPIFRGRFLLPIILVLLAICIFQVRKQKRPLIRLNLYFNVFFIFNIAIEGFKLINNPNISLPAQNSQLSIDSPKTDLINKPDVYVILSDAYTSPQALEKYWKFDNRQFLDFLDSSGFHTVRNAKSSYKYTFRTMSSVWSMDYLPKSLDDQPESFEKDQALFGIINSNASSKWFYGNGYTCINFTSYPFWGQRANLKQGNYNDFKKRVYSKTLISYLLGPVQDYWFVSNSDQTRHHELIQSVKSISGSSKTPKIVFCHLMLPHDPYILDKDGNLVRSLIPFNDHPDKYLEQLKYTNKLLKELIVHLKGLKNQPIIVVMGDHGFRQFNKEPERTAASYSAFSSFYFPSEDYSEIPADLSSVNIMRLVGNQLKPGSFLLLPNRSNFYYE